jgi:hypothetical protein
MKMKEMSEKPISSRGMELYNQQCVRKSKQGKQVKNLFFIQ